MTLDCNIISLVFKQRLISVCFFCVRIEDSYKSQSCPVRHQSSPSGVASMEWMHECPGMNCAVWCPRLRLILRERRAPAQSTVSLPSLLYVSAIITPSTHVPINYSPTEQSSPPTTRLRCFQFFREFLEIRVGCVIENNPSVCKKTTCSLAVFYT